MLCLFALQIAKKLRTLPALEVGLPTLALVGAPNVGKSSLVQVLSSGTPEICNYPFTTRSIKMGHFYLDGKKHQVSGRLKSSLFCSLSRDEYPDDNPERDACIISGCLTDAAK